MRRDKMNTHFWTWPIATYLFLGGLGGGTLFMSGIFYFLLQNTCEVAFLGFGIFVGIVCLAGGCLLLIFELGQPWLFPRAFVTKTAIIKWGAVLLTIALIFGALWWIFYWPADWNFFWYPWTYLRNVFAFMCMFGSMGLMIYTGILLSSMKARPFWNTPALPVLFTVSAMSTGCALLSLCIFPGCPITFLMFHPTEFFISTEVEMAAAETVYEYLHTIDMILVIVEITVLMLLVIMQYSSNNVTAKAVARRWLIGETKYLFWCGMIICGLLIPLLCYTVAGGTVLAEYVAPVFALGGGCLLRFLFVYNNDRRGIPGEAKYFDRLPDKDDPIFHPYWEEQGGIY